LSLIKSISGIRGTIGGKVGSNLTPVDIVAFSAAYGQWIKDQNLQSKSIIIGRDARPSGEILNNLVCGTLMSLGFNIIDLGLSTTPTVEMAVIRYNAAGGIILTASHNPINWNALKLLNNKGEFISAEAGKKILMLAESNEYTFEEVESIGQLEEDKSSLQYHINKINELKWVNKQAIERANFTVAFDAVNSSGGIAIPLLLNELGVKNIVPLYDEPNGLFPHNPEPLPANITEIMQVVQKSNADVGFVVDPDVDRLAIIAEDGSYFGEEYTLVAIADYILSKEKSTTVSNLSSSRALADVSEKHGCQYQASAVGEVNVVLKMKEVNAKIGGEGNGGIIYPELHYGRDALVGIALFLSYMAEKKQKVSEIRASFPTYHMAKEKIQLDENVDLNGILDKLSIKYENQTQNKIDGLKIEFDDGWVHLRKSNTEPIIRVYTEHMTKEGSKQLANTFVNQINSLI